MPIGWCFVSTAGSLASVTARYRMSAGNAPSVIASSCSTTLRPGAAGIDSPRKTLGGKLPQARPEQRQLCCSSNRQKPHERRT